MKDLRQHLGGDERIPELEIQNYGYLYLADNERFADVLRANQQVQLAAGAETRLLMPEEIERDYPFYNLDDILLGSINTRDEGYWDGGTVFEWLRRSAGARGAEYVTGEVVSMACNEDGSRIESVTLASGEQIVCRYVVNASGPRAALIAKMAGIDDLPVEPRKRYTWIFKAENKLDRELPLTIDPSGVHFRQDGPETYLVGSKGTVDPAVDPTDFAMEDGLWENEVWPAIANRIPQFDAIRVINEWTGHYAYNVLDQNAVIGPHPQIGNFLFINGFRPRSAAITRNGPRSCRVDHPWRIQKPGPVTLRLRACGQSPASDRKSGDLAFDSGFFLRIHVALARPLIALQSLTYSFVIANVGHNDNGICDNPPNR